MSEFLFIAKVFILAIVAVAALQMEWEGQTLERRVENGVIAAGVTPYLQEVAKGGAKLVREGRERLKGVWDSQVGTLKREAKPAVNKRKIEKLTDDLYEE